MAKYIHVPDEAPAVPKIDVTVDENDYRPGALKLIKELRPSWKPSEVKMKVPFVSFFKHFTARYSLSTISYSVYNHFFIKKKKKALTLVANLKLAPLISGENVTKRAIIMTPHGGEILRSVLQTL